MNTLKLELAFKKQKAYHTLTTNILINTLNYYLLIIIFRLMIRIKHKCNKIKLNYIAICTNNKRLINECQFI